MPEWLTSLFGGLDDDVELRLGVGGEAVEGDDDRQAVLAGILDVSLQVADALGDQVQVLALVRMVQGLACRHCWAATVHLQRSHCTPNEQPSERAPEKSDKKKEVNCSMNCPPGGGGGGSGIGGPCLVKSLPGVAEFSALKLDHPAETPGMPAEIDITFSTMQATPSLGQQRGWQVGLARAA